MIQLKDLSLGFKEKKLLDDISIVFETGHLTALIGRNGCGKSTLMKAICGLNNDYNGKIIIEGDNIRKISRHKLARLLSYVNTRRPSMSNLKCRDVVALGRSPHTGWHGSLSSQDNMIIDSALEIVRMHDYATRYINTLSDGECQKIMIARAIAQDTPVILLDEPTSFLDLPTRHEIVGLLQKLAHEKDKTIIFSTHEIELALQKSDDIAIMIDATLIKKTATPSLLSYIFSLFHLPE